MGTSGVTLPDDHPFLNVQSANYWSATPYTFIPNKAWFVDFRTGEVAVVSKTTSPITYHAWCVRGGQSFDGNTHNTLH